MAKKKKYMALFVKEIVETNEPVFLTFTPVVKITAKPIFASDGRGKFFCVDGQTKEKVDQKLKRLKAENNLFWGTGARKVPKNAEIIVLPL